ncbi:protein JINGUBANG-like [Andrographis paniculata]|uniref:protein JINGUBANG-like n=1 Tax=Andrographis paniculata TaxID=175694 RepID=UPI0021E9A1BF|nr:protein JINGUBANG-like [Andrographis paniculata]
MKLLCSWLSSTCSSSSSTAAGSPSSKFRPSSDACSSSSISSHARTLHSNSTLSPPSSSSSSSSSIQSNASLLTLPSVPSLQKSPLAPLNASSAISDTSIKLAGRVNFLALHNNLLLYAASGDRVYVYDITSCTLVDAFSTAKFSTVKSIAFIDGKVFTAHQDGKIRGWKRDGNYKHKLEVTLPTLEDRVRRFILPRNYITVRRHKKKLSIEHYDAVSGLAVAAYHEKYSSAVLSISWDKSIKFWEPRSFRCLESINKAHYDAINAVAVSEDGLVIYTASADRRIKVWKREAGKTYGAIATLEKHKSAVNALALSRDGSVLFSGSCDRSILVWEREDSAHHMAVTGALRGHAKAILCLCLIDGQDCLLLSGSADRTVRMWQRGVDGRSYWCVAVLDGHRTPVRSLAAGGGGGGVVTVFSGSFDGEIKIWQLENIHACID